MRALLSALLLGATGCLSLDPFLYERERPPEYELDPNGAIPEETVRADQVEQVRIAVSGEIELGGVYVKASTQPPLGYVIFFHGKGGSIEGQFWRTKRWANIGFDILSFDYRGYGTSTDVTPSEEGIAEDGEAVRAWMLPKVTAGKPLLYWGQSFGTGPATQLASAEAPSVLIVESPFPSLDDVTRDSTQMDLPAEFVSNDSWRTKERIKTVAAPVLVLHGLADEVLRYQFGQELYQNANDPKQLVLVEGAGHDDLIQTMGARYGETIKAFVAEHAR